MTLGCVDNGVPWLGGLAWGAVMFFEFEKGRQWCLVVWDAIWGAENSFGGWLAMLQPCTQVLVLGRTGDYFSFLFVFGISYTLVMR